MNKYDRFVGQIYNLRPLWKLTIVFK